MNGIVFQDPNRSLDARFARQRDQNMIFMMIWGRKERIIDRATKNVDSNLQEQRTGNAKNSNLHCGRTENWDLFYHRTEIPIFHDDELQILKIARPLPDTSSFLSKIAVIISEFDHTLF